MVQTDRCKSGEGRSPNAPGRLSQSSLMGLELRVRLTGAEAEPAPVMSQKKAPPTRAKEATPIHRQWRNSPLACLKPDLHRWTCASDCAII
jgi:hypothetical protein